MTAPYEDDWGIAAWAESAACRDAPPEWFDYPASDDTDAALFMDDERHAAELCAECPVRDICQSTARAHHLVGLWGGMLFTSSRTDIEVDLVAHLHDSLWWRKLLKARRDREQRIAARAVARAALAVMVNRPRCGKVDCDVNTRHVHTGALQSGERIVVTPKIQTAPSWSYANPHGTFLNFDGFYAYVVLDDDTHRATSIENLVRERLWHDPVVERRIPKPLHRPAPPLDPGPWDEPTLPDAS